MFAALPFLALVAGCLSSRREATPPDCGSYEVAQSEFSHASATVEARQECLLGAFESGEDATLTSRFPTEEGDPIVVRYEVTGRREVIVRTDMSEDRYAGGPTETEERCTALSASGSLLTVDNCV